MSISKGYRRKNETASPIANALAALLFCVQIVLFVMIAAVFPAPREAAPIGISLGNLWGIAVLIGLWIVFGRTSILHRLLFALVFWTVLVILFGCFVVRTNGPAEVIFIGAACLLIQAAMAAVPLWLMRRAGWTLARQSNSLVDDEPTEPRAQYQLRHLFVWTSVTALLFAIGRVLIPRIIEQMGGDDEEYLIFFLIITVGHALIAGPVAWTMLARRRIVAWGAAMLFTVLAVSYLEYYFISLTVFARQSFDVGLFVISMIGAFVATLVSYLLVIKVKGHGFQLLRENQTSATITSRAQ